METPALAATNAPLAATSGTTAPRMSAVVHDRYGTDPANVLTVTTVPRPSPAPGEVLVKVHAASVDRGRPLGIAFDDIRRRAAALPVGIDVQRQQISPDGKWLLLSTSAAGQQNLYVFPIDEL